MEVSGQPHAPVTLPLRKSDPVPFEYKTLWGGGRYGRVKEVEIFALVGIRATITRLSSPWPYPTRFAISAPKFRAGINSKRTCLTFTGILFLSQQLRTWKRIEALRVYPIDYV
jgi:hypothetical protein